MSVDPVRGEGKQLDSFDLAYVEATADQNITGTTSAAPTTILTLGPFAVPGGDYYVELFTPGMTKGTTNLDVELKEGATVLAALSGHLTADIAFPGGVLRQKVTLQRGTHTLTVTAFVDAGTGVARAGAGTTGARPKMWARVRPA